MVTSSTSTSDQRKNSEKDFTSLEAEIKTLREDISQISEHIKEIGSLSMSRAQRVAREGADQIKDSAEDFKDEMIEMVREKPLCAVALAAGIGYLFALIRHR